MHLGVPAYKDAGERLGLYRPIRVTSPADLNAEFLTWLRAGLQDVETLTARRLDRLPPGIAQR